MKATIVDLRYRMNDVLKALDRNETVTVLHRGKIKGVIRPVGDQASTKVEDDPFFGSRKSKEPVDKIMHRLRGGRCGHRRHYGISAEQLTLCTSNAKHVRPIRDLKTMVFKP
jgi:hypothetical protein